jgi:hypothetical protein
MPYEPIKKGTLLIPSGSWHNPDAPHLHVIVTDSCANGQHLLVSISTLKENQFFDDACLVDEGEHDFITARSFVYYRKARLDRTTHIVKCVNGGLFRPREPTSESLFERICQGINASRFIPKWTRTYYIENGE